SSDIALATQMFGTVSGADVQQQAMGQGQGPALTEMLMMAMLMGKGGKGKSALESEVMLPWFLQPGAPPMEFKPSPTSGW
ncbi:MAG: hypothetical protein Q7T30_00385, partial [Planctomycetota bacterium]|nr:hypothetical protein [Planctomycetota bacterium]